MKAVLQSAYGLDSLSFESLERPVPGPGQVLVEVRAAGVDRGAWHLATGLPYAVRLGTGLRRPRRRVPGSELAGVVAAVGPGVTAFAPGDEVYGVGPGAFAQYVVAPVKSLARRPSGLTFEEAAALPISGVTAQGALFGAGALQPGQRVLVLGAGGGVGALAVLLAKAAGAHVTGESSTAKTDLVASLGADEVLDRAAVDACDGSRTFDLVVDTAGNRPLRTLRKALSRKGTLVIVGGEGKGGPLGGFGRQLRAFAVSPFVPQRLRPLTSLTTTAALDALRDRVEAAGLHPALDAVLPLADAAGALRRVESGATRGKVVLTA